MLSEVTPKSFLNGPEPRTPDYQMGIQLVAQRDDLLVRFSQPQMGLRDGSPAFFDSLYLLVEQVLLTPRTCPTISQGRSGRPTK